MSTAAEKSADIRMVVLSDTHHHHHEIEVPNGDIVLHAGDMTHHGTLDELRDFSRYFLGLPHPHKIVVAGNHDRCLQEDPTRSREVLEGLIYLEDEAAVIEGIKFYGSPWQPEFEDWAFNLPRGEALRRKWELMPDDTEVLLTHCPPYGCLDEIQPGVGLGCADLYKRITVVKPSVHCFGHFHESAGVRRQDGTYFINASICDGSYRVANQPTLLHRQGDKWTVSI